MKIMSKSLEGVANLATIMTCVAICGVLGYNTLASSTKQEQQLKAMGVVYVKGAVLPPTKSINYGDKPFTVLVGLNSKCRYCAESMPELRRLDQVAREKAGVVRVIAIAAEPIEIVSDYLRTNSLTGFIAHPVEKGSPLAGVVDRTPSVVLLDRKGEVLGSWPGLVTESRMNELLDQLRQPGRP